MFEKAFTLAALAALVCPALCAEWLTDFEAARQKAAAEHKPIIMDFTGSDWCGACMHLHRTIFEKPEFDAFVKDRFVLLEIDCPHGDKMPKEEKARNEALVTRYAVHAFPTVLVLAPNGDVTGGFLGSAFSMEKIQQELEQGLDNFAKLEKAQSLTGDEKLKALGGFYNALNDDARPCAVSLEEQIIQADPQDTLGFGHRRAVERQRSDIKKRSLMLMQRRDPQQIMAVVRELQPTVMPENLPMLMELKTTASVLAAQSEDDLAKARDAMRAEMDTLPDSPEKTDIAKCLDATFSDIHHLYLQLQATRARQAELERMTEEAIKRQKP